MIVRPNLFLQNIPESTIPSIDQAGNFYVDAGEARISMVDTRDVAAVAAVALLEPGHAGARYDVTGPEALSYHDVAAKLSTTLGRPIRYVNAPDDAVRDTLAGFGLDAWFADALVGLYQDYRRSGANGYAAQISDTVTRLTGQPARSADDLLQELAPGLGASVPACSGRTRGGVLSGRSTRREARAARVRQSQAGESALHLPPAVRHRPVFGARQHAC